jgi:hypothetical protein
MRSHQYFVIIVILWKGLPFMVIEDVEGKQEGSMAAIHGKAP